MNFGSLFIDIIYKLLNGKENVIYLYSLCGSRKYPYPGPKMVIGNSEGEGL